MRLRLGCRREIFTVTKFADEMQMLPSLGKNKKNNKKKTKNPLTFKHKWQPHITVITTLQAGIKINICYLKRMEKRK